MRWPRVRFTVRRLMGLVAIIGLVAWSGMTWRRGGYYRAQARRHARLEDGSRDTGLVCRETVVGLVGRSVRDLARGRADRAGASLANAASMAGEMGRQARLTAHHARLRAKYESAAARPWRAVAPDPPDPTE